MSDPLKSEKPHISPSQVTLYEKCAKAWEMRYVIKPSQITESDPARAMGTAVHAAIEADILNYIKQPGWLPRDAVQAVFESTLSDEVLTLDNLTPREMADTIDDGHEEGVKILKLWFEELRPELAPIACEVDVELDLGSVLARGRVDLVDGRYSVPRILDWKISASKWPLDALSWHQGIFYAAAWEAMHGVRPEIIQLYRFRRLKKVPKLETDSALVTADMVEDVKLKYRAIRSLIELKEFSPTGLGTPLCVGYCDYRDACDAFQRDYPTVADPEFVAVTDSEIFP